MISEKLLDYIRKDNVKEFLQQSAKEKVFIKEILDEVYKNYAFRIYDELIENGYLGKKSFDVTTYTITTDLKGKEIEIPVEGVGVKFFRSILTLTLQKEAYLFLKRSISQGIPIDQLIQYGKEDQKLHPNDTEEVQFRRYLNLIGMMIFTNFYRERKREKLKKEPDFFSYSLRKLESYYELLELMKKTYSINNGSVIRQHTNRYKKYKNYPNIRDYSIGDMKELFDLDNFNYKYAFSNKDDRIERENIIRHILSVFD